MDELMNPNIEQVFSAWLKLKDDEKRDFMKELFHYNNLPPEKQKVIKKKYGGVSYQIKK